MTVSSGRALKGWLQLVRPPNLLTVPGDPIAGFLLASILLKPVSLKLLVPPVIVSILLYMAGLISNDCFDYRANRETRPERPVPSGAVPLSAAIIGAVLLAASALAVSAFMGRALLACTVLLLACIVVYNGIAKRIAPVGAFFMGVCRGLSLALGAVAAGYRIPAIDPVTAASGGMVLYIMAVTLAASRETMTTAMPIRRWLPAAASAAAMAGVFMSARTLNPVFIVLSVVSVTWPLYIGHTLSERPAPEKLIPAIGGYIRGLLLIQAAFAAITGVRGMIAAGLILCAWPASVYLSRKYSGS